ncbi:LOW QUALITY PROTEIN: prolyl endopeptidase-like [Haliotis cracherodii]|uniref:LOW QUALITY PROTEIN: prolyl endopeptidase-like n=1 Tax=Haliotis cracherodii TaxID=6455 RepID=UPI0039ED6B2C
MGKFTYPNARRDELVEDYHGTKVTEYYRWLEDPDCEETKAFVEAQNELSKPFLDACPIREKLSSRITEVWDYPKYSCPGRHGEYFYYYHNTGLQNQSVLYAQKGLGADPSVFLDPNSLSEDGTVSLRGTAFSENDQFFAYGLSKSGSDWVTIKFKKAPSGEDLPDTLERVKFSSMAWTHDHKGLFYNRYLEQKGKSDGTETTMNVDQKLFYHRLGTDQSEDVLVAEFPEHPRWMIGAEVSDCGRYLVMTIHEGCDPVNRLYYVDLKSMQNEIRGVLSYVKIVDNFDAEYEYITNDGSKFTFKTNLNASRYKLINIDFADPDQSNWQTLVDEDEKSVLEWAACVNKDKLILCYLKDVKNELYVHGLSSGSRMSQLPLEVGSVVGYSGKKKYDEIFYQFTSFLTPGIIYRCDMTTDTYTPKTFREIKVKDFDTSQFETEQVFFPSKDGTKIPMFIVHRKGLVHDGSHPVMLYGYGGFNISITPSFSPSRLVFLQHLGGVYAIANIRGGGEYGESWHKAGNCANKQNVFDDFQSAAQYLIENKWTSAKRITINGGSNGGLLVGACINQRPDLFGCAVAQVGVLDMLRFHKFTIGHAWTTDYGSSDSTDDFKVLIKYSPLHNIREQKDQYPALLLLTGDHDDRVVPLHSLKFLAQIQYTFKDSDSQVNPLMGRIDTKSGHGFGKPTAKVIEELTDIYSFMHQTVGLKWSD